MSTTFIRKLRSQKRKEGRLDIVSECYKKAMSFRDIRDEVMKKLELKSYSLQTVHADIKFLDAQWKDDRMKNVDEYVNLELKKIDGIIAELWTQYNKSKFKMFKSKDSDGYHYEEREVPADVAYIAEMRQQEMERRKILGLYKPEQKNIVIDKPSISIDNMSEEDILIMASLIFDSQKQVIQI